MPVEEMNADDLCQFYNELIPPNPRIGRIL